MSKQLRHAAVYCRWVLAPLAMLWIAGPVRPQGAPAAGLHLYKVQGRVWALVGGASNITVQAGEDGVLLVNTGLEAAAPEVLKAVRTVSDKPIRWIINTSIDASNTGANGALPRLSAAGPGPQARIIAHENILNRMSRAPAAGEAAIPEAQWPNDEYYQPSKDFAFNGEAVIVYHMPAAHTDGDSIVHFRRSDVISAGGIYTPGRYPVIDREQGGSVQGVIAALNRILEITVPLKYQEGGTYVIPGQGRISDEADVVEYRDMVTIVRDNIQDYIAKGMSLEQVKAARPTREYDPEYTRSGGPSADAFIEAVYSTLSRKNP
jgi:glyoxylase-like metal-dependent hydrolase (beta-lactamase superfamily II)